MGITRLEPFMKEFESGSYVLYGDYIIEMQRQVHVNEKLRKALGALIDAIDFSHATGGTLSPDCPEVRLARGLCK